MVKKRGSKKKKKYKNENWNLWWNSEEVYGSLVNTSYDILAQI